MAPLGPHRLASLAQGRFSVKTTQRFVPGEHARLQRLARYLTRVVLAVGAVDSLADGRLRVETAPDLRTGRTSVELDRLDLVHALCQQIPDAGMHMVRYYGAYSNRRRRELVEAREALGAGEAPASDPLAADLLLPPDLSFEDTHAPAPPAA